MVLVAQWLLVYLKMDTIIDYFPMLCTDLDQKIGNGSKLNHFIEHDLKACMDPGQHYKI